MIIREANRGDCAKLDELLKKLIRCEAEYDRNLNPDCNVENNYDERLDWPGHKAFVAEEGEKIVGFIYGFAFTIPGMYAEPIAIADALYVEEAYRNKGIAGMLLREFRNFSTEQGACRVELKVMSENKRAIRAYEAFGFSETKKYMALALKKQEGARGRHERQRDGS